ncbi:RING-H2 finger protein ATL40-like [Cicer arietinum]|uniref:RING-type E3 ubiquitin transferase n=1 Tax=Cicer arietinum TaxID=3827 RepID=A0A1S2XEU3_CICAR|nr:RING-H2 finger protein ATL40-like [Cicer arietinum]
MNNFDDDRNHDGYNNFYPFGNSHGDHNNDFNKKILLTAIVSLSLVLILVFALHLYAKFIFRRQARRRAAIHHLSVTVAQAHAQLAEQQNTGLDPSLINSLPTFIFKRKQHNHVSNSNVVECSVCLSVFEDDEILRLLPKCKHSFHVGCIDTWLASKSTCPVCRTKVEPRLEPHPREGPTLFEFEPLSEGTSDGGVSGSPKNISRLSSFRRILTRERSSRRIQPSSACDDIVLPHDLERQ